MYEIKLFLLSEFPPMLQLVSLIKRKSNCVMTPDIILNLLLKKEKRPTTAYQDQNVFDLFIVNNNKGI